VARSAWAPITGKVIVREIAKVYGGGSAGSTMTRWKYVVEYSLDGGESKRVELRQAWGLFAKKMISPPEGTRVPLIVNRRTGNVRFDVKDPALNWKVAFKADGTELAGSTWSRVCSGSLSM